MKKLNQLAGLIIVAIFGFSTPVLAVENIAATKHNLTVTGTGTIKTGDTTFICGFCHSPHTDAGGPAPLWNRSLPLGTGYTMYTSATMDMAHVVANEVGSISLACLSCHDGTIALDSLVNLPGSGGYTAGGAQPGTPYTFAGGVVNPANLMPAGVTNLGTNLTGDHPVSITYDITADTAFETIATAEAAGVSFFGAGGNEVECASCHNPHEATNATFLRVGIDTLCTSCHIK